MKKRIYLIGILLYLVSNSFAQSSITLNDAWKSFYKNDWLMAKEKFQELTSDESSKSEAYLGLSLVASMEGNDEESFDNFIKFFELEPNGQYYLYSLWFSNSVFGTNNRRTPKQVSFLESLIKNTELEINILKLAYSTLAQHYAAVGNFKMRDFYAAKIGTIINWKAVGEFENISESGFNKDFDPLFHPENDYVFKNKKNANITWFELKNQTNGQWIFLRNNFICYNAIVYLQNFCNSPIEQDVFLRIGCAGSLKIWINDALVYSNKEEVFGTIDNDIIPIHLSKGYNRILLQLGCSDLETLYFLARITDKQGNDISDLSYTTEVQKYTKANTSKKATIDNSSEQYFKSRFKANPDDLIAKTFLAKTHLRHGKIDDAYDILKETIKIHPKSNYLLLHLSEVYSQKNNNTEYSRLVEQIKINEPEGILTQKLLLEEELQKEEYLKAEAIAEKLMEATGETEYMLTTMIRISASQEKIEDLINYINKGYSKYPNTYAFVQLKALVEKEIKKSPNGAIKVIENFNKSNFDYDANEKLLDYYLETGNTKKAFQLLNKCITYYPNTSDYHEYLSDINFNIRKYEEAAIHINNALAIAPFVSYLHEDLGNCYREMDNKEDAIAEYNKCIALNPNKYSVRHTIRELEEKPDVFDYFTKPDYDKIYKNSPNKDAYPDQNILSLYDEVQKVVYPGGGSEEIHIIMIKALKSTGIDMLKTYSIPVYSNQSLTVHKAEVMKKNGSKLKAERSGYDIVFTNLEEGDAIVLEYKIENYHQAKLLTHFWDKYYFDVDYPYQIFKYSLLVPPDVKFNYKVENMELEPKKETKDEFVLYTWERKNVKAIVDEKYMPAWEDVGAVLYISTFPDWDFVGKWYADLSKTKAETSPEIKEAVNEIFKDKGNLTDLQKAREIYNYIVSNIRYSSVSFRQSGFIPQKAEDVLNTRLGDCKDVTTLFITMCREVNLDAKFILVSSRYYGKKNMVLPSIDFDHAIARLDIDGKSYYVELTTDLYPFNTVDKYLLNSFILQVADEKGAYQPVYLATNNRIENGVYRKSNISFDGNRIVVDKQNKKTGHAAANMRNIYKNQTKEQQKKDLLESLSSDFANVKLDSFSFNETLNNTADSINYFYSYSATNPFTKINNMNILRVPYGDMITSADFLEEDRKFPVELWLFDKNDYYLETINVKIPKDKKLAEVPKNVKLKCKHADYSLSYKLSGSTLTIVREFRLKNDFVELADIKELKDFYVKVIQSDANQIGFIDLK